MKRFSAFFLLLFVFVMTTGVTTAFTEGDFSSFTTDDGKGSVIITISNEAAMGRTIIRDLMLKQAWWSKSNPDCRIVSVTPIYSSSGYIKGQLIHYENPNIDYSDIEANEAYVSSIMDNHKGSLFIRSTNEYISNLETIRDDLIKKKACVDYE